MMKPTHIERLYRELGRQVSELPAERRQALTQGLQKMSEGKLSRALRDAIRASEKTPAAIAWEAELNPSQVYRFLDGGTITLDSADALADVLGAELHFQSKPARASRKPARAGR